MQGAIGRSQRPTLAKAVTFSVLLHAAVIVFVLFVFKPESKKLFFAPVYTVSLVERGPVRAKPKPKPKPKPPVKAKKPAAPEKVEKKVEEPKATVKVKQEKKPEVKKETLKKPAVEKKAVSLEKALEKIKKQVEKTEATAMVAESIESLKKKQEAEAKETERALEELKKRLAESRREEPAPRVEAKAPPAEEAAPRQPSGGRITRQSLEVKYPAYYSMIRERVQENWTLVEDGAWDNLSIIVSIRIGRGGELLSSYVEKSSGDSLFDQSLIGAVKKAAPFPALPEDFEGEYMETGLRFCPRCSE